MHRAGLRRWPASIIAPVVLVGLAYSIAWLSGALAPADGIDSARVMSVVHEMLVSIAVGSATFVLSEELGWSSYLLPPLSVLGQERAGVVRGLLHAVWHFPLIFLTTTYLIHGNRLVTMSLFVVTLTCAGLAYAYFRFSTNSVWPGAIAHAAFNYVSGAFDGLTDHRHRPRLRTW